MTQKRSLQMHGTLDGGLSWFVVLGSFMTQFVVMGIHNVFGLLYLDLLTEFRESKATTGLCLHLCMYTFFHLSILFTF